MDGRGLPPTVVDLPDQAALPAPQDLHDLHGPVAAVVAYRDFAAVVRRLNAAARGGRVAVFTRDIGRALRAARELDFTWVHVNEIPGRPSGPTEPTELRHVSVSA